MAACAQHKFPQARERLLRLLGASKRAVRVGVSPRYLLFHVLRASALEVWSPHFSVIWRSFARQGLSLVSGDIHLAEMNLALCGGGAGAGVERWGGPSGQPLLELTTSGLVSGPLRPFVRPL